ncbi:hypothetical protein CRI94_12125 [Longibacter salinarum]|uniref:Uncharacterized protein n=1 Tax=Longibacter salinarum TaxID=1850348 RepID=A0A2A8CVW6_9BACT|nr:hypothetical protein [Longibacter salinarum]PEN12763.1 hypothetical protein CRI94_12125 [Longibacter salinarum]
MNTRPHFFTLVSDHLVRASLILAAAFLVITGCDSSSNGIVDASSDEFSKSANGSYEVCEYVDFNSLSHGDAITSGSIFGTTLSFSADRYAPGAAAGISPVAFDTDLDGTVSPDPDLVWNNGQCADCDGQGRLLVIPSSTGFAADGDHQWGGKVTISGFSGSGIYIKSYVTVDNESYEAPVSLYVDGVQVGASTGQGNGSVEKVTTTSTPVINNSMLFTLGTETLDNQTGSGGIDDLEMCRMVERGDEGCTLGYWKNHTGDGPGNQENAWAATGYSPYQTVGSVFSSAAAYGLDDDTLLEALSYRGGPDATAAARLLLKQAIAAVLSSAHPDVAYAGPSASTTIANVNAALDSGDRETMLDLSYELDEYNNAGCPL